MEPPPANYSACGLEHGTRRIRGFELQDEGGREWYKKFFGLKENPFNVTRTALSVPHATRRKALALA